ncbi:sulfotransferase [Ulvibacterium sp.]|uniref:sulfotransferase n=1 Tax=Ulvibacterium sp. TaxID=2665914 RepID=UPI003BAB8235
MSERKTIIYILSNQRSGSTLIENILSKSNQMVSIGESFLLGGYIHKIGPGVAWDWNCSCGESLEHCHFWNQVYEKIGIADPRDIKNTKIIFPKGKNKDHQKELNKQAKSLMNRIYSAVFDITDCDILVDSSKEAFYGISLYQNSPYKFKFIHLRRDLRAVSISKHKWRKKYNKKHVSHIKLLLANYLHRLHCKSMLKRVDKKDVFDLNYEDFFKNPQKTLDDISDFFGFDAYKVPEFMELNNDHTIAGTPNRFKKTRIKYDNRWEDVAKKRPFFNACGYVLNRIG